MSQWYIWCKPCTYLTLTLNFLQMERSEIPHDPHHLGVPSVASKRISEPVVRSMQTCPFLGSRLPLCPNWLKRASAWGSESPSLVLVINDTKLLMPLCQVNWVRRSNTCDEGARSMMVMAIRSLVHEDKDDGEHAHRWWTRNEMIKAKV
jgi:hypothetical protein